MNNFALGNTIGSLTLSEHRSYLKPESDLDGGNSLPCPHFLSTSSPTPGTLWPLWEYPCMARCQCLSQPIVPFLGGVGDSQHHPGAMVCSLEDQLLTLLTKWHLLLIVWSLFLHHLHPSASLPWRLKLRAWVCPRATDAPAYTGQKSTP